MFWALICFCKSLVELFFFGFCLCSVLVVCYVDVLQVRYGSKTCVVVFSFKWGSLLLSLCVCGRLLSGICFWGFLHVGSLGLLVVGGGF